MAMGRTLLLLHIMVGCLGLLANASIYCTTDNPLSTTWLDLSPSAPFARSQFGACSFRNGTIVLAGGVIDVQNYVVNVTTGSQRLRNKCAADVWTTHDGGRTWVQTVMNAPFGPRCNHMMACTVSGIVVLMQGLSQPEDQTFGAYVSPLSDVWNSHDFGQTWTLRKAVAQGPFRASSSLMALTADQLMIVSGQGTGIDVDVDSIFSSAVDGGGWSYVTGGASMQIPPRHFAMSVDLPGGSYSAIVFGGFRFNTSGSLCDTWMTLDKGTTWHQLASNPGWCPGRVSGMAASIADPFVHGYASIFLVGGRDRPGNASSCFADVWHLNVTVSTYPTQSNWTLVRMDTPFPARSGGMLAVTVSPNNVSHPFVLTLFGGVGCSGESLDDIWMSADGGKSWYLTSARQMLLPFSRGGVSLSSDARILVAGGTYDGTDVDNVGLFSSSSLLEQYANPRSRPLSFTQDGPISANWTGRNGLGLVSLPNGTAVVFGGFTPIFSATDGVYHNDVYANLQVTNRSAGPILSQWAGPYTASWSPRCCFGTSVVSNGTLLLYGGLTNGSRSLHDVYQSDDAGRTWQTVVLTTPWAPRFDFAFSSGAASPACATLFTNVSATSITTSIIVLAGGKNSSVSFNDVWVSIDLGRTWMLMTANASWCPRSSVSMSFLPDGSLLLLGGRNSSGYGIVDSWVSRDCGGSWVRFVSTGPVFPTAYGSSLVAVATSSNRSVPTSFLPSMASAKLFLESSFGARVRGAIVTSGGNGPLCSLPQAVCAVSSHFSLPFVCISSCSDGFVPVGLDIHSRSLNFSCVPCEPCFFSNLSMDPFSRNCSLCPPNTFSTSAATNCTVCPAGYQCLPPSQPQQCANVSFSVSTQQQFYVMFSLGGVSEFPTCTFCPAGHQCPSSSLPPQPCLAGYFSLGGNSSVPYCVSCPPGFFCANSTLPPVACGPGSYSDGVSVTCESCDAGYYCYNGSRSACPPGTFSDRSMRTDCSPCPVSHYCNSTGIQGQCPKGTYSPGNSTSCALCPGASWCPFGNPEPIPCPNTTYSLPGWSNCSHAPPGFQLNTNRSALPVACKSGQFSLGSNSSVPWCTWCPAGFACPLASSPPEGCPAGHYATVGFTQCSVCPAGFFCGPLSVVPSICRADTYSLKGSASCIPCPPGMRTSSRVDEPPSSLSACGRLEVDWDSRRQGEVTTSAATAAAASSGSPSLLFLLGGACQKQMLLGWVDVNYPTWYFSFLRGYSAAFLGTNIASDVPLDSDDQIMIDVYHDASVALFGAIAYRSCTHWWNVTLASSLMTYPAIALLSLGLFIGYRRLCDATKRPSAKSDLETPSWRKKCLTATSKLLEFSACIAFSACLAGVAFSTFFSYTARTGVLSRTCRDVASGDLFSGLKDTCLMIHVIIMCGVVYLFWTPKTRSRLLDLVRDVAILSSWSSLNMFAAHVMLSFWLRMVEVSFVMAFTGLPFLQLTALAVTHCVEVAMFIKYRPLTVRDQHVCFFLCYAVYGAELVIVAVCAFMSGTVNHEPSESSIVSKLTVVLAGCQMACTLVMVIPTVCNVIRFVVRQLRKRRLRSTSALSAKDDALNELHISLLDSRNVGEADGL